MSEVPTSQATSVPPAVARRSAPEAIRCIFSRRVLRSARGSSARLFSIDAAIFSAALSMPDRLRFGIGSSLRPLRTFYYNSPAFEADFPSFAFPVLNQPIVSTMRKWLARPPVLGARGSSLGTAATLALCDPGPQSRQAIGTLRHQGRSWKAARQQRKNRRQRGAAVPSRPPTGCGRVEPLGFILHPSTFDL